MITVAPLAGAWIEIYEATSRDMSETKSLPSRERGLKSYEISIVSVPADVAPLAGAWIEIDLFREGR